MHTVIMAKSLKDQISSYVHLPELSRCNESEVEPGWIGVLFSASGFLKVIQAYRLRKKISQTTFNGALVGMRNLSVLFRKLHYDRHHGNGNDQKLILSHLDYSQLAVNILPAQEPFEVYANSEPTDAYTLERNEIPETWEPLCRQLDEEEANAEQDRYDDAIRAEGERKGYAISDNEWGDAWLGNDDHLLRGDYVEASEEAFTRVLNRLAEIAFDDWKEFNRDYEWISGEYLMNLNPYNDGGFESLFELLSGVNITALVSLAGLKGSDLLILPEPPSHLE